MCCVEVAVVSACGGGGCIVVMRWIVVATVRIKHDLTVEQLCWTVRRPQRHTIRQSIAHFIHTDRTLLCLDISVQNMTWLSKVLDKTFQDCLCHNFALSSDTLLDRQLDSVTALNESKLFVLVVCHVNLELFPSICILPVCCMWLSHVMSSLMCLWRQLRCSRQCWPPPNSVRELNACCFKAGAAYYTRNIPDTTAWVVPINQATEARSNWSVHDEGSWAATSRCRHWSWGVTARWVCACSIATHTPRDTWTANVALQLARHVTCEQLM